MSTNIVEKTVVKQKIKMPGKFKVIMHNDDVTPMDLVMVILITVFKKAVDEAEAITVRIHETENGVVGVYPREIAEMKQQDALSLAGMNGFTDFKITIEEE